MAHLEVDVNERLGKAVDGAHVDPLLANGWDVLSTLIRKGQFHETDYLGQRELPLGVMQHPFPVRLSNGISLNAGWEAQARIYSTLQPKSLKELEENLSFYHEYFGVDIKIDQEKQALRFSYNDQEVTVKFGVDNVGLTRSRKERFAEFYESAKIIFLGLLAYPAFNDIREYGLVVGNVIHTELSALALPGKYLKTLHIDAIPKNLEDDVLYMFDSIDDNEIIASLPEDFLQPIRPVGVLYEQPKEIKITPEDATGSACCGACGRAYPLDQVIAINKQIFVTGESADCSKCGYARPELYIAH